MKQSLETSSPSVDQQSVLNMCATEKAKHDRCFHQWLNEKFLKGIAEKDDCEDVWKEYENCINQKLKALGLTHLKKTPEQMAQRPLLTRETPFESTPTTTSTTTNIPTTIK
jgi:hypothetical protein